MDLPKIKLNIGINTIQVNTNISPFSFKLKYNKSNISDIDEEITTNDYFENKPNNEVKPISVITLRSSEVRAAGQSIYDDDLIEEYGVNELIIEEDYIAYTDTLRNAFLEAAKKIFGLTYKPLSIDLLGNVYLDFNDVLQITDSQNNVYTTYALNNVHEYNGTLYNTISIPALTETEEKYKYETEDKTFRRKTAIEIDKANQQIQSIVNQIGDRSEKQTTITQDIDGIELKVSDIEDLTLDVQGANPITLENCMTGNLLELKIKGNNTVFAGLTPNIDLTPSINLKPYGDSILKVYTINICPDNEDDWENGRYSRINREWKKTENSKYLIQKKPFRVDNTKPIYISVADGYKISYIYEANDNRNILRRQSFNAQQGSFETTVNYILIELHKTPTIKEILPEEVPNIKPMVTYSTEQLEYVKHHNQVIDLGISAPLRQLNSTVYDEFVYAYSDDYHEAKVIRRVGLTGGGQLYELTNEIIEIVNMERITLERGTNYIDIGTNYTAILYAKYVQITDFTEIFATTYEVESAITQLANSITLLVREKVNKEEVIAELNLEVAQGIATVKIIGNRLILQSDNFELTADGVITARAGTIGKLTLLSIINEGSYLYKDFNVGDDEYQSGLFIPDDISNLNLAFLYAGLDKLDFETYEDLVKANLVIKHNGEMLCKRIKMFVEDGYAAIYFDNNRQAMALRIDGIYRYLSNGNYWCKYGTMYDGSIEQGEAISINDALFFGVYDDLHDIYLARFFRIGNQGQAPEIDFYANTYVNGSPVQTGSSDRRLKDNIKDSDTEALPIIEQLQFKQFDWNKEKSGNEGHIDIGFIAQEVEEIDENMTIHSYTRDGDLYTIDLLNTLAITAKAVQELSQKVKDLEEEIKKLKGEK